MKYAAKDGDSLIAQPPLSAQSGLWLLQGKIEGAESGRLGLSSVLICRNGEGSFILKLGTGAEGRLRINQAITLVGKHLGTQALTMTNFFGAERPEHVPIFQLVELYGD